MRAPKPRGTARKSTAPSSTTRKPLRILRPDRYEMGLRKELLWYLLCFLLHLQTLLGIETVSQFGVDWPHTCVQYCLGKWPSLGSNIGEALQCGTPFYNDCYCATATASATKATSFLEACASSSCAAGDLTLDLSAMQSKYASYCMQNGFTQPGATNWYNPATATRSPAPSNTPAAGPTSTATKLTVVTQTTSSGFNGGASAQPRGKCLLPLTVMAIFLLQVLLSVPYP